MSIYHCSIKIINRSGGRSAIASAAYRSGDRLRNEETGLTHDFTKKGGIVMSEILLPVHSPERFKNREVLWNEVQKIEKRSDAQFAREVEVALPEELDRETQIMCVRGYIQENFVSEGMIADWALHDKGDGNPHAHIMLTMRGIDEHEQWLQKQKSVFANSRDAQGRPIYDPDLPVYDPKDKEHTSQFRIPALDKNGVQKTRVRKGKGTEYLWEKITVPANDWNEHSMAEKWRASWAEHCNRYLESGHKIDHRSYQRQGIDAEPTIHEGFTARQMENEGKTADRCQINREIKERNSIAKQMRELAEELTRIITEKARAVYERIKRFRRHPRDAGGTGRDAGYSGKPTGRDREPGVSESDIEGTTRRIHELKRTADESGKEIERTDEEIKGTDRRIEELRELSLRKEAERDERLERLRNRRASHNDGRSAGRSRDPTESAVRSTAEDILAFLRELSSKERASEEKRDYRVAERENREAERQRSRIEAERQAAETERRIEAERREHKKRSRSNNISL